MMKKLLLSIFIISSGFSIIAQPYENDWIDFSKQYFKIEVYEDGLQRIDYNTIATAFNSAGYNLNNINPKNLQLFFRGEEQYIYIRGEDDNIFHSSDYIEFLGFMNDGTFDNDLYEVDKQPQNKHSLFTDTSSYFLTWNNSLYNRRMVNTVNDTINPPAEEPYFMYTSKLYASKSTYHFGVSYYLGNPIQYLYSSEFDRGEGFHGGYFKKNYSPAQRSKIVNTPFIYNSGPQTVSAKLITFSLKNALKPKDYNLKVNINGYNVYDNLLLGPDVHIINLTFSINYLTSPTSTFLFEVDKMKHAIPTVELTYPRTFDFENQSTFFFSVIDNSKKLINISSFNDKSTDPLLYDLTNHLRITGTAGSNPAKFVLPLSSLPGERELYITSQDNSDIIAITRMSPITFTDFSQLANQGDYIIITHESLLPGGYVDDYKVLRSSNFTPVVIMIDELYDQFAYGIKKHPLSIRNFTKYVLNEWTTTPPKYVFLIGKGIEYWLWRYSQAYAYVAGQCLIPTYGHPGSDNLLTAVDPNRPLVPQIPIGRLAATTPDEVRIYYNKVVEYEESQDTLPASEMQTIDKKLWQKRIIHFAGGKNQAEQDLFNYYLDKYENDYLEKVFYGADVTLFKKSTSKPFEYAQSLLLDSLINEGVSLITFFGHAAANLIEFNLDPDKFENKGRYPFVVSNGCFSGQIHSESKNMSENFVINEDKGAIGFLASVYLAVQGSLDRYSTQLFKYISDDYYGKSIGFINKEVLEYMQDNYTYVYDEHLSQQSTYHGDPAISVYPHGTPDYVIEKDQITFDPAIITAKEDSFDVNINVTNIGKALNGSIDVRIIRQFPDGSEQPAFIQRISAPYFQDAITITIPTEDSKALGPNKITIKVDAGEEFIETTEENNEVIIDFYIISEDLIPVYPYEYSIVSDMSTLSLKASTANAFAELRNYIIEIDTTELFNSPLKVSKTFSQKGGVVVWDNPSIPSLNNTVYYWRATPDSNYNNGEYSWNGSSFTYINGSLLGWNQSHYFQFLNSDYTNLELPSNRKFKFVDAVKDINAVIGINTYVKCAYYINSAEQHRKIGSCVPQFIVAVLDSTNAIPYSYIINCRNETKYAAEFNTTNSTEIQAFNDFLDSIPDMQYVLIMGTQYTNAQTWSSADSLLLTNTILSLGGSLIGTVPDNTPYLLFSRKGDLTFTVTEIVASSPTATIDTIMEITGQWDEGYMISDVIGPATSWNKVQWSHQPSDVWDKVTLKVVGLNSALLPTTLASNLTSLDTTLSFVNAAQYPFLQLQLNVKDDSMQTAEQLQYWKVLYNSVGDAALNANKYYIFNKDSLFPGEPFSFSVALENIGGTNMDSMLVRYIIIKPGNIPDTSDVRLAPLPVGDTLHLNFSQDTKSPLYQGTNTFIVEANPENDQYEQYRFNNVGLKKFYVDQDFENPLLDITFDGRHILDGDIVSASPQIMIKLKDENKYLALDDSSLIHVEVIDPNGDFIFPKYDDVTMKFTPADPNNLSKDNTASIEYNPTFTKDGIYKLNVSARDKSKNESGDLSFGISFEIIRKPMITNVLNYPNPFTTSTKFVFTLTGHEVPTFFKIQIMTVSGRIVREITQNELGPIYVGPNITEFSWDGTDQYGDKLGNGVYLYRVITNINGTNLSHFEKKIDMYFKSGFGKMYLVR